MNKKIYKVTLYEIILYEIIVTNEKKKLFVRIVTYIKKPLKIKE